jgi:xylan 1,4-beta-xylosidase
MTSRLALCLTLAIAAFPAAAQQTEVTIRVEAGSAIGPMRPIWAWFGNDEPNYTCMKLPRQGVSLVLLTW